jgi:hypothetical protein
MRLNGWNTQKSEAVRDSGVLQHRKTTETSFVKPETTSSLLSHGGIIAKVIHYRPAYPTRDIVLRGRLAKGVDHVLENSKVMQPYHKPRQLDVGLGKRPLTFPMFVQYRPRLLFSE